MDECRSEKVREILEFLSRAAKCRSVYHGGLARLMVERHRAEQFAENANALKAKLTDYELSQLRRARRGV